MTNHGYNTANKPGPSKSGFRRDSLSRRDHEFKSGDKVYSKRCGMVAGFDGVVVAPRGGGFQVRDEKTGNVFQRDRCDLIPVGEATP
jgi:hypothetical protein